MSENTQEQAKPSLKNQKILDLETEFVRDFNVSDCNVRDKAMEIAGLKAKWLGKYIHAKRALRLLNEHRRKLKEDYVRKHGKPDVPKVKTEKELDSNEKMIRLNVEMQDLEECVEFLGEALKDVHGFSYDISNVVRLITMEQRA